MKKIVFLWCVSILFTACSTSNGVESELEETTKELKLSENGFINTDAITCEFEIINGNGEYTASVSQNEFGDDNAKVTIDGSKVKVDILAPRVTITIADKKERTANITINSSAQSLVTQDYTLFMENETVYTMTNISFGSGKYSVDKLKGNSAEVTVDENDNIVVKSLTPGNSYYKLTDQRGTTSKLNVLVGASYDLTSAKIEISAINDQIVNVWLKYGDGDWKFFTPPASPLIEKAYLHLKGDIEKKYDILQINTTKENIKGNTSIELIDKNLNRATINLKIN